MIKLLYYSLLNYFRDFEAVFWTIVLPLVFLVLFKFVSLGGEVGANVLIVNQSSSEYYNQVISDLKASDSLFINEDYTNIVDAKKALETGDPIKFLYAKNGKTSQQLKAPNIILYIQSNAQNSFEIIYDPAQESQVSSSKEVEKLILESTNATTQITKSGLSANKIEFYDVLVPGILAFSISQAQTTSLAILIATQKEKRIFKRIAATPLSVKKYLFSLIIMHLFVGLIQASFILMIARFAFHAHFYGNILSLYALVILGNLIFLNIGFIAGSLTKTAKAANGIASGVVLPMLFFSGVFFPRSSLPEWAFRISKFVPLTPLVDAIRGVSLYNKSLAIYGTELIIIGVWIVVCTSLSLRVFKFRE